MSSITFDTLEVVHRLKNAGIEEVHAEAIVQSFRDMQTGSDLATKRDVSEVRSELKRDMAELKAELIKWVVTVGVLQTGIIAALVMKLVH